jgi:hypothetical protein
MSRNVNFVHDGLDKESTYRSESTFGSRAIDQFAHGGNR